VKQGYIQYREGSDIVDTRESLIEDGDPEGGSLKPMDEKLQARLEKLRDLVLFRYSSTGVNEVLKRAAQLIGLIAVYPVKNVQTFGSGGSDRKVFRDCVLVKR